MKANLVKIGNSRGVRIPKVLIQEAGLPYEVELEVQGGTIVIRPAQQPREGWGERFKAMAARGDDALLDGGRLVKTSWETEEWEW
jgi:antitoxin MazE